MKWIKHIPVLPLAIVALLLGMAPYPSQPQPHLLEKLGMLFSGTLVKPVDIFDLFLHGTPLLLLILRLVPFSVKTSTEDKS